MARNIPVLTVSGNSLAEAYEKAIIALFNSGINIKTQYDKPGDPLSLDSTMDITILDPLADPMIHKAFPGGIEDLKEYSMELMGAKDHWVKNINDPEDTRWEYTYHQRLQKYGTWREGAIALQSVNVVPSEIGMSTPFYKGIASYSAGVNAGNGIDQIQVVIDKLAKQPFTRQAQMITWMPNLDTDCYDPPCLQSLWYRILEDDDGSLWLNCNVRFRSNDAWGANFMNMFGFTMFNKEIIAKGVSEKIGKPVNLGRMNWHADSWHIYGKDIANAKAMLLDRIATTTVEERTFNFHDDFIQEMFNGAEATIIEKIKNYDQTH
jgi:thymidylate synthase